MNYFNLAFRSLFKKGQNNIIKILSLGVGLAMGLVLISKVYFEFTFDDFYPDAGTIYQVQTKGKVAGDDEPRMWTQVSGGIAPGLRDEIPQIESATRFTYIMSNSSILTSDKQRFSFNTAILGDTCLFDVLPRPIIAGNAKETLSIPGHILLARSVAERIGNPKDIIGKSVYFDKFQSLELIIGGVFEDIPENSHAHYDIIVSMPSISKVMWDGSMNFMGNDRYLGYVKFFPGTDPETLTEGVRKMQEKHQDLEAMKEAGVDLTYAFMPLTKLHKDMPEVKQMTLLLSLLAFAVIFTAMMNYILIVISSIVNRTKGIAVDKCYGAGENVLMAKMLTETFVHLLLSLIIATILIFVFRGTIEELLSVSVVSLFSLRSVLLLMVVCILVFLITGIIPAKVLSNIPVLSALRGYKESKRGWKLVLLFFQFTAAAFLVVLLIIIGRQYNRMINDNPGYTYENVLYANLSGVSQDEKQTVMNELKRLSEVEAVASSNTLPIEWASGNNVFIPGESEQLFNIADLYWANPDYLSLMEIPIKEGKGFNANSAPDEIVISQSFADRLLQHTGWADGVVGKQVRITEHGLVTIVGVYPEIRIGSIAGPDTRPSAMFFTNEPERIVLIKLYKMSSENIGKINALVQNLLPNNEVNVTSYKLEMVNIYNSSRLFRNAVMIGGIITLIITLIGLIGYTNDEVNRRRKEVAIRKINGASITEIQKLFASDVMKIALPALVIGCIASAFTAMKWMENFSEKANLSIFLFLFAALLVLSIVIGLIALGTYRAAIQNPAETVKSE